MTPGAMGKLHALCQKAIGTARANNLVLSPARKITIHQSAASRRKSNALPWSWAAEEAIGANILETRRRNGGDKRSLANLKFGCQAH